METIRTYLENMFKGIEETETIKNIKGDLLSNMEDKYHELIDEGLSENEAIGIVISEFGNIDEIMQEFQIIDHQVSTPGKVRTLIENEVNEFLVGYNRAGLLSGIGVFLCLFGTALLVLVEQFIAIEIINISEEIEGYLGLIPLLTFIAIGVALIIIPYVKLDKYTFIKKGQFILPRHLKAKVEMGSSLNRSTFIKTLVIGLAFCIMSPISFVVTSFLKIDVLYGVIILLLSIGLGVFLILRYSGLLTGYSLLINKGK